MAKYVGFKIGKVHESYVISEYYCGGCGWPVTDHDSFCPECGGAFRECDASNLEDENAKLREYVRMLAKATVYGPCEWCQHDGDGTCGMETEPMRDGCKLYEEMSELGVEVDG